MRVPLKVLVSAAVISMTGLAFAALSQNFVISYSGGANNDDIQYKDTSGNTLLQIGATLQLGSTGAPAAVVASTFTASTVTSTGISVDTPGTIANPAGEYTQTVAAAYYILEPSGVSTQHLANPTSSGQVVEFINGAATNVMFSTGDANIDIGASDITLGATDVLSLRAEGAIWYRRFNTDN